MPQHKQYTPAFKLEIAKLMVEQNYTLQQACEVAGAGATAGKRWRQQYLAEVLDLFSRKIVGWQVSDTLDNARVLAALNQATLLRQITPPKPGRAGLDGEKIIIGFSSR